MEENQNQQQEDQIETIAKSEYDKVIAELEEVKGKLPKDLTEEEIAIQTKQQELWQKEVNLSLKSAGLEQFATIVKVSNEDELQAVIGTLNTIINDLKVSLAYVPKDNASQNEYDVFASKKDTQGMIATKLSKLFG